ncbi:biotin transporter BioY [Bacillus sp. RG28]|uniref:Biotin transporter n=1 Tax=Gottfriedia endophytica TaxID=2820819 RepID=A0A940SJ23_9BACI|nr:biotin transporter BioY [Gottfriedia endophytica]MBP0725600.1 biotin transporter BioY [Gottfriedia endophytica]
MNKSFFSVRDITFSAMFIALMAIGANIVSWIPFLTIGSVPLTLQPFFAVLAGLLLGRRVAFISMVGYLLVGLAGAPVFAGFSSGPAALIGPTGGFIFSFPIAAFLAGWYLQNKQQPNYIHFLIAATIGIISIYLIGTNYMYMILSTKMNYATAWIGMAPFALKDVVFTFIAASISPSIYKAINPMVSKQRNSNKSA